MWGFRPYVSVAEQKINAEKKLKELQKKNKNCAPVIINGKKLSSTWWGMAWNENLESYADYSNRIGRGRSYLRNGAVLDLQINEGSIDAMVLGSSMYKVHINVKPLNQKKWDHIVDVCSHRIGSMEALVAGQFPKELSELFTSQQNGLFPSPKEMDFKCSCPDYAYMCKHIAAVLYGVGTRLDSEPQLFFKLRSFDIQALIQKSLDEKLKSMLKNSKKKSGRVMEDVDLTDLFGV